MDLLAPTASSTCLAAGITSWPTPSPAITAISKFFMIGFRKDLIITLTMSETEPSRILSGKTALIAGASRGIGLAIAKETAAAGADTILASRNIAELTKQADALKAAGYSAEARALDMSD